MRETSRTVAALTLALGLAVAGPGAAAETPSVSISSARLALMQLVTATGDSAAPALSAPAEGAPARAIYLQSGTATLGELAREVADTDRPDALVAEGDTVTARLPIVVLQGAELDIGAGKHLVLDRAEQSFVLSLGKVTVQGATVTAGGTGPEEGPRPFLAGVGQDSLAVQDSILEGLGFGEDAYSAGVSISGRGLLRGGSAAPMTGNTFRDLRGVAFSGIDAPLLSGNTFDAPRGTALRISEGDGGSVHDNSFEGTGGAYALHVSGMSGLTIDGNGFRGGAGKAVRIDDAARDVTMTGNFATGFSGTAITVAEGAGCTRLSHNVVSDNEGGGIRADRTGALILDGNVVAGNAGAGVGIARQQNGSASLFVHNTLQGNRSGIRGVGLSELRLARNDLSQQLPRLLSGDLDQLTPVYLRATRDDGQADIRVEGVSARPARALRRNAAQLAFDACSRGGSA